MTLADAVRAAGVKLPDHPQVPAWLTGVVALRGEIIEGPPGEFVLFDDWLGASPAPEDPVVELARRHAHAHPPSAPEDFAAWSGLGVREARRAYAELDLEEVEVLGRRAWVPRGLEPAPPHVRLLPAWDGLLLGHRDRSLIVREEHARAVTPGRRDPRRHAGRGRPHRGNVEARARATGGQRVRLVRLRGRGRGRRAVQGQGALTGVYVRSWSA